MVPKGCHISVSAGSYVYTSSEGGRTWTGPQPLPTPGVVSFTTPRSWVLLRDNTVALSTDGGSTWSPARQVPLPAGWHLGAVQFSDLQHGYAPVTDIGTGPVAVGSQTSSSALGPVNLQIQGKPPRYGLLATDDGGATWRTVAVPQI